MPGPTDLEQLLLEYINDARIDPMGDAARYIASYSPLTSSNSAIQSALSYFGVSGSLLSSQFAALTPVAPVAWNENLATAARNHSQAMINADTQDHNLPGETPFGQRDVDAGYTGYSTLGENIYAYASSDLFAQAGFMVDWGGSASTGGMQSPAGHRANIMSASFREVGVGILQDNSTATSVGPLVITEDFGARYSTGAIILGTAYIDKDHDNFYSVGEGLATLSVSVGSSTVTSWSSGGFTLAPGVTGAQTVNFSGAGLSGTVSAAVTLTSASNLMFEVVNGNTLQTTASTSVSGNLQTLMGLGVTGLTLTGGAGVANIIGSKGNDIITGGSGNNQLTGGLGNDTLDGGDGTDVAIYSGLRSAYTVTANANGTTTVAGPDGTDTLIHIELLQFSDQTISLTSARRAAQDLNGDSHSDILFQNSNGQAAAWLMNGTTVSSTAYAGGNPGTDWKLIGTGDFDGDGKSDLFWQNANGQVAVWLMDGATPKSISYVGGNPGTAWKAITTGDFDGDGKSDILLENASSGQVAIWEMNGATITNVTSVSDAGFHVVSTGDFNGDGKSDILFQAANGQVAAWLMNGLAVQSAGYISGNPGSDWVAIGTGDLDGDGKSEILFQNTNGQVAGWTVNGTDLVSGAYIGGNPTTAYQLKGAEDLDGDGKADLIFQNTNGQGAAWLMNGFTPLTQTTFGPNPGTSWHIIAGTG